MTNEEMWRIATYNCSTLQIQEEILWAMQRIQKHIGRPLKNFLEIGLHGGGSLCMWSQILKASGQLFGITLDHPSPKFLEKLIPTITGKRFSLINEASELDSTKAKLLAMLDGEKLDAIFVDSLHTELQSCQELELYAPLVASPGVYAKHDIRPVKVASTGHFYQRIKCDYSYEEKRTNRHCDMGIGLFLL